MKLHPVKPEIFRAHRWTEGQKVMTKLILVFRNFAIAHKNGLMGLG